MKTGNFQSAAVRREFLSAQLRKKNYENNFSFKNANTRSEKQSNLLVVLTIVFIISLTVVLNLIFN